jgi:3-oxoacyl-[acyl-carrier protein] reductase
VQFDRPVLSGRKAVVTGVSRAGGIGATIARQLAAEGFELFLTGWSPHDASQPWGEDPGGGERIRDELRGAGARVEFSAVDFAEREAPERLMAAARAALGGVDVLVANHARSSRQSLGELTAAELDLSFAVNARATLLLVRHFVEQHSPTAAGRIVLFTSGQYHGAMPDELPYIASKAVLQQLTTSLAVDLAARSITVNCVNPGPNDTGYATGQQHRRVEDAMPAGRWGHPSDTARLVSWLCSDEADWITGQTIASDGGWSARGAS